MFPLSSSRSLIGKKIPHHFSRNCPFIGRCYGFLYACQFYFWFLDRIGSSTGLGGAGGTSGVATLYGAGGTGCGTILPCAGGMDGVTTVSFCSSYDNKVWG